MEVERDGCRVALPEIDTTASEAEQIGERLTRGAYIKELQRQGFKVVYPPLDPADSTPGSNFDWDAVEHKPDEPEEVLSDA